MERAFGVFDMCMAVEAAGYRFKCVDELPLNANEILPDDACVVVNGPAARVEQLCRVRKWIPCGWCRSEVFACQTYYRHWRQPIVQEHFVMRPLGSLAEQKSQLFEVIGSEGRLFVRPDGFDKAFDGEVIAEADFDLWLRRTRSPQVPDDTICVGARPQPIDNEWRLFVRRGYVIAGSSYRINGRVVKTESPPEHVVAFAESLAAYPYPGLPDIYVLDVGSVGGRLALIEVGSVNACGFYGSDMSVVIRAISDEAEQAWKNGQKHRSRA